MTSTEPLPWQWNRILQLATDGLSTNDAAQNEADSYAIRQALRWLEETGRLDD